MKNEYSRITARQNPLIKMLSGLDRRRERDELRLFCAEGKTLFYEALSNGLFPKYAVVADKAANDTRLTDMLDRLPAESVFTVPDSVYEKLSDEKSPEGIFCAFSYDSVKNRFSCGSGPFPQVFMPQTVRGGNFIILEKIQDPGNLGSMLRSAVAFGLDGAVLCGTCDPFSSKTLRGAMGAAFSLPIYEADDIAQGVGFVRSLGCSVYAAVLDKNSVTLSHNEPDMENACVIIGNEGNGLSSEAKALADLSVIIPIKGIESLNAATAAAVFMYEMRK
ncbi:MAG: RNA methyltransferase [Oscillospiraceae bacterium]|nr:RNA methyltransferase [Oscillospiraceae bacterium]